LLHRLKLAAVVYIAWYRGVVRFKQRIIYLFIYFYTFCCSVFVLFVRTFAQIRYILYYYKYRFEQKSYYFILYNIAKVCINSMRESCVQRKTCCRMSTRRASCIESLSYLRFFYTNTTHHAE